MNLQDVYAALGGDYNAMLQMMMKQERVARFLRKFPNDKSFAELQAALAEGRTQDAFRAAHTMKGVCGNLGLPRVKNLSEQATEALRGGDIDAAKAIMPALEAEYNFTVETINKLE